MATPNARYEPDHEGIRAFLHGEELRAAVLEGCADVIKHAEGHSQKLDAAGWKTEHGPSVRIGKYTRLTEEVVNESDVAAAIEFGTGMGRPGQTGERPQGGYSFPHRILGKAGAAVGQHHGNQFPGEPA